MTDEEWKSHLKNPHNFKCSRICCKLRFVSKESLMIHCRNCQDTITMFRCFEKKLELPKNMFPEATAQEIIYNQLLDIADV